MASKQELAEDAPGVRRVRTTEGARFFGIPVGEVIATSYDNNVKDAKRATSLTRVKSLQRQFEAAKRVGNLAQMRNLQEKFTAAVRDYAATNGQLSDVLDSLVASRGRSDIALGKKKDLED